MLFPRTGRRPTEQHFVEIPQLEESMTRDGEPRLGGQLRMPFGGERAYEERAPVDTYLVGAPLVDLGFVRFRSGLPLNSDSGRY